MKNIILIIWFLFLLTSCGNFNLDVEFDDDEVSELITTESSERDYVWLSESEAEELATENGVSFRVVERDGHFLPATKDYRQGRINATVDNGVVTSYRVEGKLETK